MEGVSSEAASLASHLKLGKLVWIWDDNRITIEGSTEIAVSDNIPARFVAHGWRVLEVEDANDLEALAEAFDQAAAGYGRPTRAFPHGRSAGVVYDPARKLIWGTDTNSQVYVLRLGRDKADVQPLR